MSSDLFRMKNEPSNFKEVFRGPQTSEKLSSDHVVITCIKCDICNSSFKTKETLKRHIESVHDRKEPFKCIVCDVGFSQKHHLNAHKLSVHEGKKPFRCNICDACFTRTGDLNRPGMWHQFMKERSRSIAAFVILALLQSQV